MYCLISVCKQQQEPFSRILSLLLYNHIHKMTASIAFNRTILLTYIQRRLNNGWCHYRLIKTCFDWL